MEYLEENLAELKNQNKFEKWSEDDFERFVNAHGMYLKAEYSEIAKYIETKRPE